MSLTCEKFHPCFGKEPEPDHKTSHLCFGKRHRPQLDELEARAVAEVLADAVDQLTILGRTLPQEKGAGIEDPDRFRDIDGRFAKSPPSPRVFRETAGLRPPLIEALLKVQSDRRLTSAILEEVLTELLEKGSFGSLQKSLECETAMAEDEHRLLEQHKEDKQKHKDLLKQLTKDRRNVLDQRTFWEKKTELLMSNLEDNYLLGGLAISYADAWEHNRREQQALMLFKKEDMLHNAIEHIQDPDGPNEEHVHSQVMKFLAQDIEMLKKDLDHWTDLYDAEMMKQETEIMQLHKAHEQQKEEHKELKNKEQQWKKVQEDAATLRIQYEEKKRIISNIVAIQAWWRGVSFRAGITINKTKRRKTRKGKKKGKKEKRTVPKRW